ncbi:hypothetical protein KIN20_014294 [Parelaphostrongylus tenuis]|uniref:Uncharacterized protein n=1 Tax=Parelaphostrongylus tenuis TaxID=148309 RepID=A0AAD5N330_PARTN|nr:hypothetical protein KIN20_014294 [Parelaphostrongylus tenuis]
MRSIQTSAFGNLQHSKGGKERSSIVSCRSSPQDLQPHYGILEEVDVAKCTKQSVLNDNIGPFGMHLATAVATII